MVAKLSRPAAEQGAAPTGWGGQAQTAQTAPQQAAPQQAAPQGGAPSGWGAQVNTDEQAQRERIAQQVGPDRSAQVQSAFSGGVAKAAETVGQTDYGPVGGQPQQTQAGAPAGWGSAAPAAPAAEPVTEPAKRTRTRAPKADADDMSTALVEARARVLAAVVTSAQPADTIDDIVDTTRELMKFVVEG